MTYARKNDIPALQVLGYAPGRLDGQSIYSITLPEDVPTLLAATTMLGDVTSQLPALHRRVGHSILDMP
jgi:hypothetical protein